MKIKHSKPYIDENDINAVAEQVKSGLHATGEKVKMFEIALSKLIRCKYARATSSGTTALHLALLSLDIKEGDEIIIPSYVCQAVLNVVGYMRAIPVLADINSNFIEEGYNISKETIKPLITNKTKVIIVPHMFGVPADIRPLLELANENNIIVVEDCAQSLGVKFKEGKLTGSKGLISVFSFYATKIISTGQGGMILTSSKEVKNRIDELMEYDKKENYKISYNYDMTDIQAILGLSQLEKLDFFIERRKEIAKKYDEAFIDLNVGLVDYNGGFPYRYILRFDNKEKRDDVMRKLRDLGIDVDLPVFKPLHRCLGLNYKKFKNTELAFDTCLSIPIYPALMDEEFESIIRSVKSCF